MKTSLRFFLFFILGLGFLASLSLAQSLPRSQVLIEEATATW